MLKYSTYGGSHGKKTGGEIRGLPKGFGISAEEISRQLIKRKCGVGRSRRQFIETDKLFITCGLDGKGRTNGRPFRFYVENADNNLAEKPPITALRPGHADLAGCVKYGLLNARPVAEFAGGRSTLPHTVIGCVCRQILAGKNIFTYGYTVNIGGINIETNFDYGSTADKIDRSPVRTIDPAAEKQMVELIEKTSAEGDTLGGIAEIGVVGMPVGIGDYHKYSDKLDAEISGCLMAIPSVKGVEFGLGGKFAALTGTQANDILEKINGEIKYKTNNCGGIVGGMSSGQPIIVRLTVKPVPTTAERTDTFDIVTKEKVKTHYERSDVCVVPNICVIAENMIATVILNSVLKDKKISKELGLL